VSARAEQVALCLGEARALTRTAEAMRSALERGDTEAVRVLVEAQEIGIWRLGRLMQGESVEGASVPDDLSFALDDDADVEDAGREGMRQAWLGEMAHLAEVSRQNAVLVRDGLRTVQGMLRILTGRAGEYGGATGPARPRVFNRRA
jgi:hypothetical protein